MSEECEHEYRFERLVRSWMRVECIHCHRGRLFREFPSRVKTLPKWAREAYVEWSESFKKG